MTDLPYMQRMALSVLGRAALAMLMGCAIAIGSAKAVTGPTAVYELALVALVPYAMVIRTRPLRHVGLPRAVALR
jgi:hypothetical protein